jgi:hypothetical protein
MYHRHKLLDLIHAVVCGSETVTLGEEQNLRAFENRVLTRIFGPQDEGNYTKLEKIS